MTTLTPTKLLNLDTSVLRVASIMVKALHPRGVMGFEQLRGIVKSRVGADGELSFMPALSFLYVLGRVEYHTQNDTIEFRTGSMQISRIYSRQARSVRADSSQLW